MSTYAFIKSKLNGNVIDIEGASKTPATYLDAYPKKSTSNDNQQWEFVADPAGSGFYFIKSKLDGQVIDIHDNSTAAGAKLEAYTQKTTGTDNELWEFILDVVDPTYFFIKSKLNGNVIDIEGASTKAGTGLDAFPQKSTNNNNQLWQCDGANFPPLGNVPPILNFLDYGTGSGTTSSGSTECAYQVNLVAESDGTCHFWGSYTNRGDVPIITAPNQSFGVSIVLLDMNGKGYSFSTGGNVPSAPQSGSTETWNVTQKIQTIADNWESIARRRQIVYAYHNDVSFVDFLEEIAGAVESAVSTIGTIASDVTTVVSIAAAVAA